MTDEVKAKIKNQLIVEGINLDSEQMKNMFISDVEIFQDIVIEHLKILYAKYQRPAANKDDYIADEGARIAISEVIELIQNLKP